MNSPDTLTLGLWLYDIGAGGMVVMAIIAIIKDRRDRKGGRQ